jgi:hypothetical protein
MKFESLFGEPFLVALSPGFSTNQSIQKLSFSLCGLRSEDVVSLSRALETNTSVEQLHLTNNTSIGDEGARALADLLRNNSTIKVLCLLRCGILSDGAVNLGQVISENTSLEILNLSGNKFGDVGAIAFASGLVENKHIKHLCLSSCGITNGGVSLGQALKTNKTLKILDIGGENYLERKGVESLADGLSCNTNLTQLPLGVASDHNVPSALAVRISDYLQANKFLESKRFNLPSAADIDSNFWNSIHSAKLSEHPAAFYELMRNTLPEFIAHRVEASRHGPAKQGQTRVLETQCVKQNDNTTKNLQQQLDEQQHQIDELQLQHQIDELRQLIKSQQTLYLIGVVVLGVFFLLPLP